jgi:putative nucleotidyltransferase with HDIG domain
VTLLKPFIQSKVARRIFALFVVCALGPMLILAVISYVQVSRQLRAASRERQHQASKNAGMDLISRFRGLAGDLALAKATLAATSGGTASLPAEIVSRLEARFKSLTVEDAGGSGSALFGERNAPPHLTLDELAHLRAGKTLLRVEDPARLFMIRSFSDSGSRLMAELEPAFLWHEVELAPPGMKLAVIAPSGRVLFSSWDEEFTLPQRVVDAVKATDVGELEWTSNGSSRLGSYWTLPIAFDFLFPHLTLLVSEERASVMAPMVSARTTFILVSLLSLWVVMLLSLVQVRRSLVPLNLLTEGAQRVGDGNFDAPVQVSSGDEFEELAGAFNAMTGRLQRQFHSLSARAALDRAMLSSLDADTIMIAALERLSDSASGDYACLVTFGRRSDDPVRAFISGGAHSPPRKVFAPEPMRPHEEALLLRHASSFVRIERDQDVPTFLEPLTGTAWRQGVAFPIIIEGWLAGVLTIGSAGGDTLAGEEVTHLRQITDQIAVALANARLVQALDRLNVGTLNALARTVDAKSAWTGGHSQRVTAMAVELGRELGLPEEALDLITRGGLLHDIGKIAVPSAILDKPGRLTEAEYDVMKEHPRTGARILEPIPEYHRLIPIVLQHHEWFDGRGYPDGLAGEAISFEARIVAVADVFDALSSERPYRAAMDFERCIGIIDEGRGTQFDPRVVQAFMTMIERGQRKRPRDAA